jgi:hypothetical protein
VAAEREVKDKAVLVVERPCVWLVKRSLATRDRLARPASGSAKRARRLVRRMVPRLARARGKSCL